jgi:hypothetical protein
MIPSKLKLCSEKLSRCLAPRLARAFPDFFAARIRNPIYVVGVAKSGKSLLCSLLALHPDVAYWQEANEVWDPDGYPWSTSAREAPPLWVDPVAHTERWWCDTQPRRKEIQATFGAFQWLCRRPKLLNDTALNAHRIPYLFDHFPDARFVHVVRDGREVVNWRFSKLRKKIQSNPVTYEEVGFTSAHVREEGSEKLLLRLAAFWRETMEEVARQDDAFRLSETGRLLELTYEELCADTSAVLARTCRFAGLDPSRFRPIIQERVQQVGEPRRLEILDPALIKQAAAVMEPMLTRKGYM